MTIFHNCDLIQMWLKEHNRFVALAEKSAVESSDSDVCPAHVPSSHSGYERNMTRCRHA